MDEMKPTIESVTMEMEREEEARLCRAVDAFASAMKEKLVEKARDGRRGWDNPIYRDAIWNSLLDHAADGPSQAVDVANLAMMVWTTAPKSQPLADQER